MEKLRSRVAAAALALWLSLACGPLFAAETYLVLGQLMPAISEATITMTIASPAVVTWSGHGLAANDQVVFTTSGSLPTGVTAGQAYFVIAAGLSSSQFEFSATKGGSAVNSSVSQSGTHTGDGYHVLYTPSGSNSAVASSMHVCNQSTSVNDVVRIAVSPAAAAITGKNFIAYGTNVPFGDCIYPPATTFANTDTMYIWSKNGTSSHSLFGAEEN